MPNIVMYQDLETTDIALGAVGAIRILIDCLEEAGVSRAAIEKSFQAKAQKWQQDPDTIGGANFLRLAANLKPKRAGA